HDDIDDRAEAREVTRELDGLVGSDPAGDAEHHAASLPWTAARCAIGRRPVHPTRRTGIASQGSGPPATSLHEGKLDTARAQRLERARRQLLLDLGRYGIGGQCVQLTRIARGNQNAEVLAAGIRGQLARSVNTHQWLL